MSGADRAQSRYEDRHREREHDRNRERDRDYTRSNREEHGDSSRRRTRSRSRSRDRYTSPPRRVKREDSPSRPSRIRESPPRRQISRERSLSPYSKRAQRTRDTSPRRRSRSPEPWGSHQHDLVYDREHPKKEEPPKEKQKPNYGLSGLLAAATNTKNGVVLKYHEPPEARKVKGWRIYVYKNGEEIDVLELGGQSSYLVGRDRTVFSEDLAIVNCRLWISLLIIRPALSSMRLFSFGKSPRRINTAKSLKR